FSALNIPFNAIKQSKDACIDCSPNPHHFVCSFGTLGFELCCWKQKLKNGNDTNSDGTNRRIYNHKRSVKNE
ncbi:hypothetical protein VCHENC02_5354B, partial [Vibrio harveyi]